MNKNRDNKPDRKTMRNPSKRMNGHDPTAPASIGHECRLVAYKSFAINLHRKDCPLHEIRDSLTAEFDLVEAYSIAAISKWLCDARKEANEANRDLVRLLIEQEHGRLERLLVFHMRIALDPKLMALKEKIVAGEPTLVIASAHREQIESAKLCKDLIAQICKLRGLNAEKEAGEVSSAPNFQALMMTIQQNVNQVLAPEMKDKILELRSGLEDELNADESV